MDLALEGKGHLLVRLPQPNLVKARVEAPAAVAVAPPGPLTDRRGTPNR